MDSKEAAHLPEPAVCETKLPAEDASLRTLAVAEESKTTSAVAVPGSMEVSETIETSTTTSSQHQSSDEAPYSDTGKICCHVCLEYYAFPVYL